MRYFADTSFWLALLSRRDSHHDAAVRRRREVGTQPVVTTQLVLWEVLNGCSEGSLRGRAATFYDRCLSDSQVEIIGADMELVRRGVDLYRSRADKTWSLTDCVSFIVMQDRAMTDALTSDHHFEQAGFKALLR